jgi:hypothetical protein
MVVGPGATFTVQNEATGEGTLSWPDEVLIERRGFRPQRRKVLRVIQKGVWGCDSFPEPSLAPSCPP